MRSPCATAHSPSQSPPTVGPSASVGPALRYHGMRFDVRQAPEAKPLRRIRTSAERMQLPPPARTGRRGGVRRRPRPVAPLTRLYREERVAAKPPRSPSCPSPACTGRRGHVGASRTWWPRRAGPREDRPAGRRWRRAPLPPRRSTAAAVSKGPPRAGPRQAAGGPRPSQGPGPGGQPAQAGEEAGLLPVGASVVADDDKSGEAGRVEGGHIGSPW